MSNIVSLAVRTSCNRVICITAVPAVGARGCGSRLGSEWVTFVGANHQTDIGVHLFSFVCSARRFFFAFPPKFQNSVTSDNDQILIDRVYIHRKNVFFACLYAHHLSM